ncbi:hypothetical protein HK096_010597 [Nowakowskiella sp. JEL0078]|nr:hypothetical protein HK096_010597 [Nowakowskiella sp. JEL0078]
MALHSPRRTRNVQNPPNYKYEEHLLEEEIEDDDSGKEKDDHDDEGNDTTRCVCGKTESFGTMIQCETCDVWQHCECVGLGNRKNPKNYFCEQCQPENHTYFKKKAKDLKLGNLNLGKASKKRNTMNSREAALNFTEIIPSMSNEVSSDPDTLKSSSELSLSESGSISPRRDFAEYDEKCEMRNSKENPKKSELTDTIFNDETTKRSSYKKRNTNNLDSEKDSETNEIPLRSKIVRVAGVKRSSIEQETVNKRPSKSVKNSKNFKEEKEISSTSNSSTGTPVRNKYRKMNSFHEKSADFEDKIALVEISVLKHENPPPILNELVVHKSLEMSPIQARSPSPKSTINDLNRRAKQLQDYINKLSSNTEYSRNQVIQNPPQVKTQAPNSENLPSVVVDKALKYIPQPLNNNETSHQILERLRAALNLFDERYGGISNA